MERSDLAFDDVVDDEDEQRVSSAVLDCVATGWRLPGARECRNAFEDPPNLIKSWKRASTQIVSITISIYIS
jgi:hypothetical protein